MTESRTVRDLFEAMAAAETVEQMGAIFDDEVAFQRSGGVAYPEEVAKSNMRYTMGYGSPETYTRISRLLWQVEGR
jgi:hypothetical protein